MGLVKKLIVGGTIYGVAREFNKKRDGEQPSRQTPEPYPPQHAQQYYYPPPPPPQQAYLRRAPRHSQYQQGPPPYDHHQYQPPAPSNYNPNNQPRQNRDEKR
ncbi:hypothetical protein NLG97_g8146 [Lecanicillium saksenae]|uniref:Uncharacterized protein n=1 Tax=Lecanicillium saksenae TaxID=468837 RepID=A0ACC1QLN6_9HYPO|nr:hypothetical protein NLG97_g8146 [Lecanicillium saksenae]